VKTAVVTYRLELKIHVEDMMCAIPIKFHGLVLANESALVPEDSPSTAPWIIDVNV
jgi:hypothetical protein